jgi:hypothetical protein
LHTIHYLLASHTPFVTNSALVATTVSLTLERDYITKVNNSQFTIAGYFIYNCAPP